MKTCSALVRELCTPGRPKFLEKLLAESETPAEYSWNVWVQWARPMTGQGWKMQGTGWGMDDDEVRTHRPHPVSKDGVYQLMLRPRGEEGDESGRSIHPPLMEWSNRMYSAKTTCWRYGPRRPSSAFYCSKYTTPEQGAAQLASTAGASFWSGASSWFQTFRLKQPRETPGF